MGKNIIFSLKWPYINEEESISIFFYDTFVFYLGHFFNYHRFEFSDTADWQNGQIKIQFLIELLQVFRLILTR